MEININTHTHTHTHTHTECLHRNWSIPWLRPLRILRNNGNTVVRSPPSPCILVSKEPISSKRNHGSLGKQLMIPALKHKEDPKKSGTSCYFKKKGNAQRMMETCQKDTEARLRPLSLAKSVIMWAKNNDKPIINHWIRETISLYSQESLNKLKAWWRMGSLQFLSTHI